MTDPRRHAIDDSRLRNPNRFIATTLMRQQYPHGATRAATATADTVIVPGGRTDTEPAIECSLSSWPLGPASVLAAISAEAGPGLSPMCRPVGRRTLTGTSTRAAIPPQREES